MCDQKIDAMFDPLNTPAVLSDAEVVQQLHIEIARERQDADQAMDALIANGRLRTYYLSWAIFDPIEKLERSLATAEAALTRARNPEQLRFQEGFVQQFRVELETARALRAARESVAHTDPPDYWEHRASEARQQPIRCNPAWRDAR